MSDQKAKCSNRNCGWIGTQSQMREVVIEEKLLKLTQLHCPRCDCNSFYYKLKPGEVEKPKTGAQLIALERGRQLKIEGWSAEHDDEHEYGEIAKAAACYCIHSFTARHLDNTKDYATQPPLGEWPWDEKWWKPKDPLRDLVRAGALIAAEIDRLQRKAATERSANG